MGTTTSLIDEINDDAQNEKKQTDSKGKNEGVKEKKISASDLSLDMADFKINKQTIDLLVANVIPTTKYFESRFDHMQFQIDRVNQDINGFKNNVAKSFEKVDQKFEAMQINMDQRFEKVDQRFEKVDQRFESMISSIDRLADKLDGRDERQRNFTIRMFTIAISISVIGVLGAFLKSLGII